MAEQPGPSEQDYIDAARANVETLFSGERTKLSPAERERAARLHAKVPSFVAAVDSAFAAGWRARVPEGSEEREEWAVAVAETDDAEGYAFGVASEERARKLAEREGGTVEQRKVITTPWTPVDGDQG